MWGFVFHNHSIKLAIRIRLLSSNFWNFSSLFIFIFILLLLLIFSPISALSSIPPLYAQMYLKIISRFIIIYLFMSFQYNFKIRIHKIRRYIKGICIPVLLHVFLQHVHRNVSTHNWSKRGIRCCCFFSSNKIEHINIDTFTVSFKHSNY